MAQPIQAILDVTISLSLAAIASTWVLWWLFFRLGDHPASNVTAGGAFFFLFALALALGCRHLGERGTDS